MIEFAGGEFPREGDIEQLVTLQFNAQGVIQNMRSQGAAAGAPLDDAHGFRFAIKDEVLDEAIKVRGHVEQDADHCHFNGQRDRQENDAGKRQGKHRDGYDDGQGYAAPHYIGHARFKGLDLRLQGLELPLAHQAEAIVFEVGRCCGYHLPAAAAHALYPLN